MNHQKRLGGMAAAFLVLSVPAAGQQPGSSAVSQPIAPAPQTAPAAIRVTTRLVNVSVIVEDKHGQPMAGLTKDDFTLLDDKHPQEIQTFSVTTNQLPSAPPAPLPPDTYTNRVLDNGSAPENITVILLDGLNTSFMDQAYVKRQVVKFLEQVQPGDRLALYTLGKELRILHDFTTDATSLLAALARYKGQLPANSVPGERDPVEQGDMLTDMFAMEHERMQQREEEFALANRAQRTFKALMDIAYHVGPLPGRKNLIWVSGSFPTIPAFLGAGINSPGAELVFASDVDAAARQLNNGGMVVYPVDAHGLMPSPFALMGYPTALRTDTMDMEWLARMTGGKAFYNTNDIMGSIRAAINDSRLTYELGFYPTNAAWDGRFHRLQVKVNRSGTRVRTRSGYVAMPEPKVTPEMHGALVSQAATALLASSRLAATVRVVRSKQDDGVSATNSLDAVVTFDPHQFNLKPEGGRWTGVVDLLFVQLSKENRIVHTDDKPFRLTLLPSTYERSGTEGFALSNEIEIVPDAVELRVVVRDPATALTGAVVVPLTKYSRHLVPSKN
jgi:VWFA-related protein